MATHPFLSEAWIEAAREIQEEFSGRLQPPAEPVRLNVTVTDAPLDDTVVLGHVDTTEGSIVPQLGHLDSPDVAVHVPYDVARKLLVDQEYEMVMVAFMSGEIEVEGDISRMLDLQDFDPSPEEQALAEQIAERLRSITA